MSLNLSIKNMCWGLYNGQVCKRKKCFYKKKNICFIIGVFVLVMLEDYFDFGSCKNSVVMMVYEKRKCSLEFFV